MTPKDKMNKLLTYLILLIVAAGCSSTKPIATIPCKDHDTDPVDICQSDIWVSNCDLYSFNDSLHFNGKVYLYATYDSFKSIKTTGKIAINKNGEKSTLKVDEWTTYHENGNLKSKGNYKLGRYIECGSAGPFISYYCYKKGMWSFWFENGQKKAEGIIKITPQHIGTSCEGGACKMVGKIDKEKWSFWDNTGTTITSNDSLIIVLEESNEYQN